jgi:Mor family transcriptional regulator
MTAEQQDLLSGSPTPPDWLDRYDPKDLAARWPRTLAESVDVIAAEFRRRGHTDVQAAELAEAAVLALATHQGGRPFYLPRGERLVNALRDRVMWQQFPRKSVDQLAVEHALTTRRVEQILAEQRALVTRQIQPGLFGPELAGPPEKAV